MIDSEGKQSLAIEEVLLSHNAEPQHNDLGIVQTVGIRSIDNWKELKSKHRLSPSAEELSDQKQLVYSRMLEEGVDIMPGLMDLLAALRKQPIKIALASSSSHKDINHVLQHLGLTDYFDTVVSGYDVKHGKPSPDIFLEAASRIKIAPAYSVVIEDAQAGVEAAKAAGMKIIAVPNRYTHNHDFDLADLVVNSLENVSWGIIIDL